MAISVRLRFEILRRDNFTCLYCGRRAPQVQLEVDHVHPRSQGGKDVPSNLVTACVDCNRGKSDTRLDAPVLDDLNLGLVVHREVMQMIEAQADYARWAQMVARLDPSEFDFELDDKATFELDDMGMDDIEGPV